MQMEVYRQLEFDLQSLRMIKNRLETAFFSGLSEDEKYVWFFNKKEIISSFTLSNGMLQKQNIYLHGVYCLVFTTQREAPGEQGRSVSAMEQHLENREENISPKIDAPNSPVELSGIELFLLTLISKLSLSLQYRVGNFGRDEEGREALRKRTFCNENLTYIRQAINPSDIKLVCRMMIKIFQQLKLRGRILACYLLKFLVHMKYLQVRKVKLIL